MATRLRSALGFHAGREVTDLLMTCYMSAEQGGVIAWKPEGLQTFGPQVARPRGAGDQG